MIIIWGASFLQVCIDLHPGKHWESLALPQYSVKLSNLIMSFAPSGVFKREKNSCIVSEVEVKPFMYFPRWDFCNKIKFFFARERPQFPHLRSDRNPLATMKNQSHKILSL